MSISKKYTSKSIDSNGSDSGSLCSNEGTYEGFTVTLAMVDAMPVILFAATCAILGLTYNNILFTVGAVMTILGGMCKVLWKLLIATIHKDVRFLNRPLFIVLMPVGFLLMILSVVINGSSISWKVVGSRALSFPSIIFFVLGILGLTAMTIFFKKHDKTDARNNWIEQLTNCFAQGMILIGVVLACR